MNGYVKCEHSNKSIQMAYHKELKRYKCPKCGNIATMDTLNLVKSSNVDCLILPVLKNPIFVSFRGDREE